MLIYYIQNLADNSIEHDTTFTTEALALSYATTMLMLSKGKFGDLYTREGERVAKIRGLRLHVE
jgi:hypothetical protein